MKSMMIVDDEQIVRTSIKKLIDWKSYGYDVFYEADNGEKALTILREECVDLLFLDIRMQGMTGIDVIRVMNDENISYPSIYVITAYDDFGFLREAFRLGIKDFILKNEISRSLLSTIAEKENPMEAAKTTTNKKVLQALQYIEKHLSEKLSLDRVAEVLLLSPSHFCKLFSKEMKMPFNQYVTRRRVEHACRLLRDTRDYVYQVAEAVGFNNLIYFNKVFKSLTGVTPNDYRNGQNGEMRSTDDKQS